MQTRGLSIEIMLREDHVIYVNVRRVVIWKLYVFYSVALAFTITYFLLIGTMCEVW